MNKLLRLFLLLLWASAGATWAQGDAAAIREALSALTAEQQSVYQQFQMLQKLRDQAQTASVLPPPPGPPQNYDDLVQQRQAAADQAKRYQGDMDSLYERYKKLEEEKQPLLARLRELALQPPPVKAPPLPPRNVPTPKAPTR